MATPRSDERAMISERLAPVLLTTKQLGAFDLVVIFIGIVLFITNSAGLAPNGPSMFIVWILAFLTFLIPGAFVTAQLGRMFPEEGSLYVWTHKALGPFWGFFAGFVAWWPGPLVMVIAASLVVAFAQYLCDFNCLTQSWQQGVVILAVIWFSAYMSVLRQRVSQNYMNFQFYFYAAALFVMGLAGLVWLWKGHASVTSFAAKDWNPFVYSNFTAFSFAVLALLGIEVPLNMGVEVKSEDAIRKYLFWGCIIVIAAYLWTTWANMLAVGVPKGYDYLTGGPLGVAKAMGEFLGNIVAVILLWFFLFNTAIYNYSYSRLLFVSGLEKRLPRQIGDVNRNKVPANAVILQTILATLITIAMYFVAGELAGVNVSVPYFALLAGVTVIWCVSMVLLFADIYFVRRFFPQKFEEVRAVPLWFLYLCGVVGFVANGLAAAWVFTGPWCGCFTHTAQWNTWVIPIVVVSIVIGVAVYVISERTRRGRMEEELLAGGAPAGGGGAGA